MNWFSYLFLSLCVLYQWTLASFIIFETKSDIDFNEHKKSLYLNNQYQYYHLNNIDLPGRWYHYENTINSFYLHGSLIKNITDPSQRCQLMYHFNNEKASTTGNLNNNNQDAMNSPSLNKELLNTIYSSTTTSSNIKRSSPSSINNANSIKFQKITTVSNGNKNIKKIYSGHVHIKSKSNTNTDSKSSNNGETDEFLTVDVSNRIHENEKGSNIKKMVTTDRPILFIHYNDIIDMGCSLQEIIIKNQWENIEKSTNNKEEELEVKEKRNENDEEEEIIEVINFDEGISLTTVIPSLISIVVSEKNLNHMIKESNINIIGIKYTRQSIGSNPPITFISEKDHANLINGLVSKEMWIKVTSGKGLK